MSLRGITISVWRALIVGGVIILVIGAILLPTNQTLGLTFIGIGLSFTAVALAFIAEILIEEIRMSEIEEKIAMMKAYSGDHGARIISDLEALEAVSMSATKDQAIKITLRGQTLLSWMHTNFPNSEDEARTILNRILKRFNLSV